MKKISLLSVLVLVPFLMFAQTPQAKSAKADKSVKTTVVKAAPIEKAKTVEPVKVEPVAATTNAAVITFVETTHDFGTVKQEDGNVTYSFVFTNTGTAPLVISNATTTCGCTVPSWTKTPIEPGATGEIKVTYSAVSRPGPINKTITVTSNASEPSVLLKIIGTVSPKPSEPAVVEQEKSVVAKP